MALDENFTNEYKRLIKQREELLNEYETVYNNWQNAKAKNALRKLVELKIINLKIATTNAEILFLGYNPYDELFFALVIEEGKMCERDLSKLKNHLISEDEDLLEIYLLEKKIDYCGIFRSEAAQKDDLPELVRLSLQFARLDLELSERKLFLFENELN